MKLRILADDLTGALDSAAAFVGETTVYLDRPGDDDPGVGVVATATRDVPREALPMLLDPARAWLRSADLAFKKVDSLLRGNTFDECALLARDHARIVFAPAFPQQGRTAVAGRAWLGQPGGTASQPIGDGSITERFAALGVTNLWVPDVLSDADLNAVAALTMQDTARGWLWCGSAGLAQAMAAVHGLAARHAPAERSAGPVLLVSASRHPVLRRQWALLQAREAMHGGLSCVDLSGADDLSPAQAAARLAQGLQRLVDSAPVPGRLIVIGGDTLRALCRATGTGSLRASASLRPGWGNARLVGGRWHGVRCQSRSGAFGTDGDLLEAVLD